MPSTKFMVRFAHFFRVLHELDNIQRIPPIFEQKLHVVILTKFPVSLEFNCMQKLLSFDEILMNHVLQVKLENFSWK